MTNPVPAPNPPLEPQWPDSGGRPIVFLLDASSALERRLLEQWVERTRPADTPAGAIQCIPVPPTRRSGRNGRRGRRALDPRLDNTLATGDDPLMAPLRVVWRAPLNEGLREVRFNDLLTFGDPRDPGVLRQRWIRKRHPDRCAIVAGMPAPASELRSRWREAGGSDAAQTTGLADYVARQAVLALERAERQLRGARYKVPRLVHEEILERPAFLGEISRLARENGIPEAKAEKNAARYLREIAATHSPYVIDLVAHLIRRLYTQGYGEALQYDREKLAGLYSLAQQHPLVFLPTHKSNLDHLVLQYALHENGLPPNHTAGGINMNFFPLGPLVRRSGVFFIRRTFRDNPIYKYVLRSYVDYLIEKRFSLEWYIEGGRSRSGKLLPPRFGMLAYVVDAYRRAKSEDVILVPVSIGYDQIQDVGSYAAEQRGAAKQQESLGWFIGVIRALRRRYGNIHIRFGDPVSLRSQLGPPAQGTESNPDERDLELQKLAFEVSVRINRETAITPTSLVALALLGTGDRALSASETRIALGNLVRYVAERKLPVTSEIDILEDDAGVCRVLDALAENGVVSRYDEGPETVYAIGPEQQLAAAYYRNSIIHFFVNGAIIELALLRAAAEDVGDPVAAFWDEAMALRDLLKFEFFFAGKDAFRAELRDELAFHDVEWEERLAQEVAGAQSLVRRIRPYSAHRVLRPFLESYAVVSEKLAGWSTEEPLDEDAFVTQCLSLGRQLKLQHRIRSAASISKVVFQTALKLAANRGLLDDATPDLARARQDFDDEVRAALRRVDAVEALAASRRAGFP